MILVVRGGSIAESMSDYLVKEIEATSNIEVRTRTSVAGGRGRRRLEGLVLENVESGRREDVRAAALFVMIGASPRSEWLSGVLRMDGEGYVRTGSDAPDESWPLDRHVLPLETSMPGVFAVGDVREGSVKRVASAVGEGSVAIRFVHEWLAETVRRAVPA